jgi:hypothetical protein
MQTTTTTTPTGHAAAGASPKRRRLDTEEPPTEEPEEMPTEEPMGEPTVRLSEPVNPRCIKAVQELVASRILRHGDMTFAESLEQLLEQATVKDEVATFEAHYYEKGTRRSWA